MTARTSIRWLLLAVCTICAEAMLLPAAPLRASGARAWQPPLPVSTHRRCAGIRACDAAPSKMGKGDLVDAISQKAGVNKKTAALVLGAALDVIVETVSNGDKVSLVGFGTFHSKHKEARIGRNPGTQEKIELPATVVPTFSFG